MTPVKEYVKNIKETLPDMNYFLIFFSGKENIIQHMVGFEEVPNENDIFGIIKELCEDPEFKPVDISKVEWIKKVAHMKYVISHKDEMEEKMTYKGIKK